MPGQLPSAVVSIILRYIYAAPEGTGVGDMDLDIPSLQSYSLVARSWRTPTQQLLFYQVNFTSMRRFMRIRSGMKSSPSLTVHVRILSLGIGQNYQTHVQGTELPDILNMFPYLYELRLHVDRPAPLPLRTIQQLASSPPICALRLTLGTLESPDFLLQLLQVPWPLQHLSISQPHVVSSSARAWVTAEELHEQASPSWKLLEYRTDGFSGWEAFLEWAVLASLETLRILHMPPSPQNSTLALVSPRLRSLNLVYDPYNSKIATFNGMADYPPFPVLQELIVTNAVLGVGQKIYQSIPFSVCHFATTLRVKLRTMIEICPTIPMRMETITVFHDGKLGYGWEWQVQEYANLDGRLRMKRRLPELPPMVPFHDVPRDDAWLNKRAMDVAVADRRLPEPTPPVSAPKLLRMLFCCFSADNVQ